MAEQASDAATRIATEVAKKSADVAKKSAEKSADVRSQVGQKVTEVARAVAEERHELMQEGRDRMQEGRDRVQQQGKKLKTKKPRRHRLRNSAFLVGVGAVAAYFLDPQKGEARRAAAMRRTSDSAQTLGVGLDKAAQLAHQTAGATATHDASIGAGLDGI